MIHVGLCIASVMLSEIVSTDIDYAVKSAKFPDAPMSLPVCHIHRVQIIESFHLIG